MRLQHTLVRVEVRPADKEKALDDLNRIGSTSYVRRWLWATALCVLILSACNGRPFQDSSELVVGGNPQAGWQAIQDYGCQTCHTVPGIPGAPAYVGPPLNEWPSRSYIAGNLSNTPDNLIMWIRSPQEVEPGTAMPDLGVSEEAARNITAYLFDMR